MTANPVTLKVATAGELDIQINPARGISPRSERKFRDRPFADAELQNIWDRMDEGPSTWSRERARLAIRLLLLTGQRREQVTGIQNLILLADS